MGWLDVVFQILHRVADTSVVIGDVANQVLLVLGGIFAHKVISSKKPPEG